MNCPVKTDKDWIKLVNKIGIREAYREYIANNYDIPNPDSYDDTFKGVNVTLKVVDALENIPRSTFLKEKAEGFYNDLKKQGVSQEQLEMLKEYIKTNNITKISKPDLIMGLLAESSYTVEIKVAEQSGVKYNTEGIPNVTELQGRYFEVADDGDYERELTLEEYNELKNPKEKPSQYYSNLTVPGGTNYTENEIATPAITPSIKGHAQFSTDNGIGWFRSDDKVAKGTEAIETKGSVFGEGEMEFFEPDEYDKPLITNTGTSTKTRRILELQSDLFQKGRDRENLITGDKSIVTDIERKQFEKEAYNRAIEQGFSPEVAANRAAFEASEILEENLANNRLSKLKENQFLQLLNKDSNWVTFFVKSIIQDSARKGYEKVLFPKGETAAKIEGHETLANELIAVNAQLELVNTYYIGDYKDNSAVFHKGNRLTQELPVEAAEDWLELKKQELSKRKEDLKSQGIEKLKPIEAFYEVRVGNILKKLGKVETITDEYGNEWYEVNITPEDSTKTVILNRLASLSRTSTPITQEEIDWFKERFPNISVEIVKGLIERRALGQFISSGKVLLSDVATSNTLRHEAFHVVTQLYLTPKEIKDLYKEVRNKYSNKKLTDLEVEEILAEDFANYKDTGRILDNRPIRNTFFGRLLSFIRELLGLTPTQVKDVYNKLETGYFSNKPIIGTRQFTSLDRAFKDKTELFTKEVLDGVDYHFYRVLFKNGLTPEKLFEINNLSGKLYDKVFDAILAEGQEIDKLNEANPNENTEQLVDAYEYILNNWDEVLIFHNERTKALGVDLVNSVDEKTLIVDPTYEMDEDPNIITEASVDSDEEKANKEGTRTGDFENANTISTKDVMFKQTKLLIRTLPKVDKNGKPILNSLKLPQLVDFNSTYNFILKNLAGITNYPDMITKLEELSTLRPELKILIERIKPAGSVLTYDQIILQNQFRQDFDKNQTTSYKTILKADGVVYMIDATRENTAGKVKELWKGTIKSGNLDSVKLTSDGKYITYEKVVDIKDPVEFLSKIGITFSNETLPALKDEFGYTEKFNNAVEGIKKFIREEQFNISDLFSEKSTNKGNMNVLADLEAEFTPNLTELSYMSAEGKTVYSISLNNMLSIVKNIINNSQSKAELFARLPHLDTVNTKNSIWIKELFDSKGRKRKDVNINLDLFDGLSTEDITPKVAKQTTKLGEGDRAVQELNNLLLNGKTAFIRASDKAQEHALTLSKYSGNSKLAITFTDVKDNFNNDKLKSIIKGYFKDEVQSIFESAFYGVGKNIDVYRDITEWDKNDNLKIKWALFEGFPDSDTIKKQVKLGLETIKKSGGSDVEMQVSLDNLVNSLETDINRVTIQFFDEYFDQVKNELKLYSVTEESKLGISKELWDKGYTFDQMLRVFVTNDFINSVEQTKLFIGDMRFYKAGDFFKRTSGLVGTKKTARVDDHINEWLNINIKRTDNKQADGKINVLVFEDVKQKSNYIKEYIDNLSSILKNEGKTSEQAIKVAEGLLDAYNSMDEGDAQGWITLDEYREFYIRVGNKQMQTLLTKAIKGEILTADELLYITPIKAQYFGPQDNIGNIYAPAYHKYSLMPLIPQLIKGKNLELLANNMRDNQVGYAVFKSGSKVGTVVDENNGKANKFYTSGNNGDINNSNLTKQIIDYRFLGIQLDIDAKVKEKVIFGTQFRKLLFSNAFEGGKELFPNAQKLLDEYSSIFEELIAIEQQKLIEELGLVLDGDNYVVNNMSKLIDMLQEAAKQRSLADNIVDALQREEINGRILMKYKVDSMVNKAKVDSMLMSLVNSRLIRQMMNGDAMIQGASTGFEKQGRRIEGSNELKFYRKDPDTGKTLPMQVRVPLTGEFKNLLKGYGSLEAINAELKKGKDSKINKKLITLVGYRIPTQGLNSIEFMEIEEFLPEESTNLIILPTEIVAKSGGDYDIDKLNVFRPWLNTSQDISKYKQNRIIEIAREVLEHEYNFTALITPNSTKILTDIVAELRYIEYTDKAKAEGKTPMNLEEYTESYKKNLKNVRYTNQLKFTTKLKQFAKFLGGKSGVGIGALQNTHHVLSQIADISLNRSFIDKLGNQNFVTIFFPHNQNEDKTINLSKLKDIKGNNNISEVISQIINASVDIAKDPFMFDLNMNMETLSTYAYLVRTGVEFEQIAYFMKQPIITEYLKQVEINRSVFLKAADKAVPEKTKYKFDRMTQSMIVDKVGIIDTLKQEYEKKLLSKLDTTKQKDFETYMSTVKPRYDISTAELKSYLSKTNQDSVAYYHVQLQVLDNYLAYKDQATMLSDFINSVNHDTAGVGANLDAADSKEEQKERVRKSGFIKNIDNVYKTFVGHFDKHDFSRKIFDKLYDTRSREAILENTRTLVNEINPLKEADRNKLATLITNDFINYVIQNYGYDANISDITEDLFKGENSVAKQLLRLKTDKNLSEEDKVIADNMLVKELQPLIGIAESGRDNIKIYTKRYDTFTANQLTESFRELQEKRPDLAKGIMDLGILQSGLNNSPITYLGLIPFEYYGDLVKHAFSEFDKKNGVDELYKFNELFLKNNTKDSNIFNYNKRNGIIADAIKIGDGIYGKNYDKNLIQTTITKSPFSPEEFEKLMTGDISTFLKAEKLREGLIESNKPPVDLDSLGLTEVPEDETYMSQLASEEEKKYDIIDETDETNSKDYDKNLDISEEGDTFVSLNPKDYTNFSGAAFGGDKAWTAIGKEFGIGKQVDYIPSDLAKLTESQKDEVEQAYQKAVKDLGRKPLEANTYAGGLVRRDYLQAKAGDAIFAVSAIVEPGSKDKKGYPNRTKHQIVEGGTGYAVQMAINLGKPVFVFDQNKNKWFKWETSKDLFGGESNGRFIEVETPVLTTKFTGIGTRELTKTGKQAIRDVYEKTFKKPKTLSSRKVLAPVRADSLNEFKKAVGLTRKEVDSDSKARILGKVKRFNKEFNTNYSVIFTKVGESNLVTYVISGGPKTTGEEFIQTRIEVDSKIPSEDKLSNVKAYIQALDITPEERFELMNDFNSIKTEADFGKLLKKLCL